MLPGLQTNSFATFENKILFSADFLNFLIGCVLLVGKKLYLNDGLSF
jgi:hypothetical protein